MKERDVMNVLPRVNYHTLPRVTSYHVLTLFKTVSASGEADEGEGCDERDG